MNMLSSNMAECAAASMAEQNAATKRFFAKAVAFVALAMVALVAFSATVGTTGAYFTTYASAKGTVEISLEEQTTIKEDFYDWTKRLTVTNDGTGSVPVYVRAKAFSGSTYPLTYTDKSTPPAQWSLGANGYYYYSEIVNPGETTGQLDVQITGVPGDGPDQLNKPNVGDNFNVVVVYETTPVLYDANGNPYADWNNILDNGNLSQGGGQ